MVTILLRSNQPATLFIKIQDLESGENLILSPHHKKLWFYTGLCTYAPETFYKLPITELEEIPNVCTGNEM